MAPAACRFMVGHLCGWKRAGVLGLDVTNVTLTKVSGFWLQVLTGVRSAGNTDAPLPRSHHEPHLEVQRKPHRYLDHSLQPAPPCAPLRCRRPDRHQRRRSGRNQGAGDARRCHAGRLRASRRAATTASRTRPGPSLAVLDRPSRVLLPDKASKPNHAERSDGFRQRTCLGSPQYGRSIRGERPHSAGVGSHEGTLR